MKHHVIISAICLSIVAATVGMAQEAAAAPAVEAAPEAAAPATESRLGLKVYIEAAYTTIDGGGQEYATSESSASTFGGNIESVETNDEVAPKIALGYALGNDLDVVLAYSQVMSAGNDSVSDSGGGIWANLAHPNYLADADIEDMVYANIDLDYKLRSTDLKVVKSFKTSDTISTALSFGFNYLKINRELNALYDDGISDRLLINRTLSSEATGLKIGIDTEIDLGKGFGAYGAFGLGLYSAKTSQRLKEGDEGFDPYLDLKQTDRHSLTSLNMGIGGLWKAEIAGGNLAVKVGYEMTSYDGLYTVEFPDDYFYGNLSKEDLGLSTSGWILGLGYTF